MCELRDGTVVRAGTRGGTVGTMVSELDDGTVVRAVTRGGTVGTMVSKLGGGTAVRAVTRGDTVGTMDATAGGSSARRRPPGTKTRDSAVKMRERAESDDDGMTESRVSRRPARGEARATTARGC